MIIALDFNGKDMEKSLLKAVGHCWSRLPLCVAQIRLQLSCALTGMPTVQHKYKYKLRYKYK